MKKRAISDTKALFRHFLHTIKQSQPFVQYLFNNFLAAGAT